MGRTINPILLPEFYKRATKVTTIYDFSINSVNDYRFIVNNQDIAPYTALGIKRTPIKSEDGTIINELELGIDNIDLAFRLLIMSGALDNKKVQINLAFLDSNNAIIGTILLYEGYMDAPKGDDEWLTITIRPFPLLERSFPRRIFQVQCNWTFSGPYCGRTLADYRNEIELSTQSDGVTFEVAHGRDINFFIPGFVEILDGDYTGEIRPVLSNTETNVIVRIPFDNVIPSGVTIRIQKLCAKNIIVCEDYFSNKNNYGGFPHIPKQPIL